MPTIIDELIVTIGINAGQFNAGVGQTQAAMSTFVNVAIQNTVSLQNALTKSQNATQSNLKQGVYVARNASQQFNSFRKEVAALFTTLATGFGLQKFVKDMANTEAATGRLATNIGMSTNELNAWQEASIRNGGTAEATGHSFLGLTQQFQQLALTGQSAVVPYFRALGVSLSDAEGEMRPMSDILLDLSDKFKNMTPQRANAFGAALGLDQGTITLLRQGREAVQQYLAEARKIGVINEADAQAGIKFQQSLANFEQAIRNLGRAISNDFLPIFETYMNEVTTWLSDPKNQEFVAKEVHEDIQKFADGVKYVIETVKQWHGAAEALALYIGGRWLLAMTVGLGPIGLAVAGIAAGFIAIQKGMEGVDPAQWTTDSPLWNGVTPENQLKYENSPESRKKAGKEGENPNPFHWWNPGSWANRPDHLSDSFASGDMNNVQRGFLDTIAGPESGGSYNIKNGGSTFSNFNQFPDGVSPGGTSTAAGRYQITKGTWDELQKKYPGMLGDFSPKNQDAAAWLLARDRYKSGSGGDDLEDDLRAGKNAKIGRILAPTWPSLPGGSQSNRSQADFDAALARNTAGQFSASKGAQENIIDPTKEFWKKNFGTPTPDPALQKWSSPTSTRSPLSSGQSNASTSETNINGPITINTQSKDADGIARDISSSLKKYSFVATANTGLV